MNFNEIKPLPVVCRQSSITCALHCERCWFYKYLMGVSLRGVERKDAATLGKIYHRLQQLGPGHEQEVMNEIRMQQANLIVGVDRGEDLDGNMLRLANQLTSLYKKAEVMAHIFWERFPQPDYFQDAGKEIHLTMEWNGLTIEGTIDKILLNEIDSSIWIRDHKSTGRSLASIFGGLAWSIQARIYRILATDYLIKKYDNSRGKYHSIRGFILDGIITPGIKMCSTDEKNVKGWKCSVEDAYLRRVKEWYRDYEVKADLAGKKNAKAIDSKGILFTEPLIPDELSSVLYKMRELSTRDFHPTEYNRDVTRTACFAYERQCIYHNLCETDPNQWGELFETKYQIKPAEEPEDETNIDEDTV